MEDYPFTWFKSLGSPREVEEWLDRVFANASWLQLFPIVKVENLVAPTFDHYLILLNREHVTRVWVPKRTFEFENAWCVELGIHDIVSYSWSSSAGMSVTERLQHCASDLSRWSKITQHGLMDEIVNCCKELNRCRDQGSATDLNRLTSLRKKMTRLMIQEDKYWRQHAKPHCYRDGDLKTKFFHASSTSHKKVNHIISLENDVGVRVTDEQGLCQIAKGYFAELFLENNSSHTPVIDIIESVVSEEDNDFLTSPFQIQVFKEAMYFMHPDKCLRPNGFNPGFLQHF